MKKNLSLLAALVLAAASLFAQNGKINYTLAKKIMSESNPNRQVGLFVKGNINVIKSQTLQLGGFFKYSAGDVASITLPVSTVEYFASSPEIESIEDNYMKLEPMCDSLVVKNNVVDVHNGVAPLPQGYDGTGVVMGIIDSGIDFNHGDFKDASGNTRIKFIWDHNLTGGNIPQPYNYGREFTAADIDAGYADSTVDNSGGHGTHVSGVAAGNGLAINKFAGVAPNADIISIVVDWNLPDDQWLSSVADAVNYIYTKASAMGKPCVINISAGTYFGSHDAKDLQAQMINNLITQQNGRSLVCAAGNAGSLPIHLQYNTTVGTDTSFTWFAYSAPSIYMEMWADQVNFPNVRFTVGADKTSPNYEFRGAIAFSGVSTHIGILKNDTLYNTSGNRLGIIQSYASLSSGRYSMIFNVIPDSTQYNWRLSYTGIGKFDLWSFQMINSGLPSSAVFPDIVNYNLPDLNQTIVSSFTCSDKVISVAEYVNKITYLDCSVTSQTPYPSFIVDSLSVNSSHGPTRTGIAKPDIASAGGAAMAALVTYNIANIPPVKIAQGCMHMRDGGTSTASPGVAGIAALYLQRYPTANWQAVKNAIIYCNKRDSYTGLTGFPNMDWGFGKVDGFAALTGCAALGLDENNALSGYDFFVTPNPFNEEATIHYDLSKLSANKNVAITIFDMLGKEVRTIKLSQESNSVKLQKNALQAGVYFISLFADGKSVAVKKLVVL